MVAAMNARSLGPVFGLAPHAQMDDGQLDVVLVRPESREMLVAQFRRASDDDTDLALPDFETHRASRIRLRADGARAHCDDAPRRLQGEIDIGIRPGAVRLLVPSHTVVRVSGLE
jgi:diacylglycerol kinase family enzyme